MPSWRREERVQFCSLCTGPSHVELGLELCDVPDPNVAIERRDHYRTCCRAPAEDVIVQSVADGLALAGERAGRAFHARKIIYNADDSNRPDMYMWIANLIAIEAAKLQ